MKRTDRGFTIVELVIIMAVIAVLAAVLIPTFAGIISKANYSKMLTDCSTALKQYRLENPKSPVDYKNTMYYDAYFVFRMKDKVYCFRSDVDENIVETDESSMPDFSCCAYAYLYGDSPAGLSEEEKVSKVINYYRVDDLVNLKSYYYLETPFNDNGMRMILEVTDFSDEYYYLDDDYYTSTPLMNVVMNEGLAAHIDPDTGYIEDYLGIRYSRKADGTSEIVDYAGTDEHLEVPEFSPDGTRVTSIGMSAFEGKMNLVSVILPEGLKSILSRAFYQCSNLRSVTLPGTLLTIEVGGFYGCSALSNVTIPQSVNKIERLAFCGCTVLSDLVLPATATLVTGCVGGIHNVTFSGSNPAETDRYLIVNDCIIEKSTGTLVAGNENSVIPDDGTVKSIGRNSFSYIKKPFDLFIPASVTVIEDSAFFCAKVRNVTGGDGLVKLETAAFQDSGLTTFTIRPLLELSGSSFFTGCKDLVLTIENGVTISSVASGAKTIVISDDNTEYKKSGSAIIRIANNEIVASEIDYVFPEEPGEYTVGQSAFCTCKTPVDLVIPENVKSIGYNGLSRITSRSVRITAGTESIHPASTLSFCYELETAVIESPVTTIGSSFFGYDRKLKTVYLPGTITNISSSAFKECKSLSDIYFAGTREEWRNITFEKGWNDSMPSYTVHCSDGDLYMMK